MRCSRRALIVVLGLSILLAADMAQGRYREPTSSSWGLAPYDGIETTFVRTDNGWSIYNASGWITRGIGANTSINKGASSIIFKWTINERETTDGVLIFHGASVWIDGGANSRSLTITSQRASSAIFRWVERENELSRSDLFPLHDANFEVANANTFSQIIAEREATCPACGNVVAICVSAPLNAHHGREKDTQYQLPDTASLSEDAVPITLSWSVTGSLRCFGLPSNVVDTSVGDTNVVNHATA